MDYALLQKIYNIKSFVGYTDEEIKELRAGFESIPHTLYEIWKKCGKTSELFNHSNDPWVTLDFQRRYKWTRKTKGYFYILNSLSAFMMGMLIYEAAISCFEFCAEDIIWYDDGDVEKIDGILNKYPYHVYNWYSDRIDLYTKTDEEILFVMQGDSPNGTYSARTETAYQEIDRLIGGIGER